MNTLRPSSLQELISVLLTETAAGHIRWEAANTMKTAYIAKRPSGTVVVKGGGLLRHELQVRDKDGKVVETTNDLGVMGVGAPSGYGLPALWAAIEDREARGSFTVQSLTEEFRKRRD